jgi:hypothetical protein
MNRTWIKKLISLLRDFTFAIGVVFVVKYLIARISPCEQVTSSHLAVMTTSVFWMIRKYPLSGIWKAKKSEL